ncbi:MAG: hypothetical protein AAGA45_07855 [Verrucomicrobiota bacterium]
MKPLFLFLLCLLPLGLMAQETAEEPVDLDGLKLGDKLPEGGATWPLQVEDGEPAGEMNLRFKNNRLRLYFVDDSGKLMKPTYPVALVRYFNDLRDKIKVPRNVANLSASDDGLYLTSPRVLPSPLRYRVWVTLQQQVEDQSAIADDELTPDKQSYGLRILSGLGKGNN